MEADQSFVHTIAILSRNAWKAVCTHGVSQHNIVVTLLSIPKCQTLSKQARAACFRWVRSITFFDAAASLSFLVCLVHEHGRVQSYPSLKNVCGGEMPEVAQQNKCVGRKTGRKINAGH
jgi:hypothetical protein